MPLEWGEVKKGLKILDFNIRNAIARVKERGDLFMGALSTATNLSKALKRLSDL